jgi:hypothetical protein
MNNDINRQADFEVLPTTFCGFCESVFRWNPDNIVDDWVICPNCGHRCVRYTSCVSFDANDNSKLEDGDK